MIILNITRVILSIITVLNGIIGIFIGIGLCATSVIIVIIVLVMFFENVMSDFYTLNTTSVNYLAIWKILCAVFLCLVSIFTIIGACIAIYPITKRKRRGSAAFLITAAIHVTIMLLLQASSSIIANELANDFSDSNLKSQLSSTLTEGFFLTPNATLYSQKYSDYVEQAYTCCGVNNYTDYERYNLTIPDNCCKVHNCDTDILDNVNVMPCVESIMIQTVYIYEVLGSWLRSIGGFEIYITILFSIKLFILILLTILVLFGDAEQCI